jgi:hypothetical protein
MPKFIHEDQNVVTGLILICVALLAALSCVVPLAVWQWALVAEKQLEATDALDAVTAAGYVGPAFTEAFYETKDVVEQCAVDDQVGYLMMATSATDGNKRVTLKVCCPASLAFRRCTVRPSDRK